MKSSVYLLSLLSVIRACTSLPTDDPQELVERKELAGCASFKPSVALWQKLGVDEWLSNQLHSDTSLWDTPDDEDNANTNLANALLRRYASKCPGSQCHCDTFESCSFGSDLNLADNLTCEDKQRVYMVLDSVANVASLFHAVDTTAERVMNELDRMQGQNLELYTESVRVEAEYRAFQHKQTLLAQFFLAFIMIATGPLSALVNPLVTAFSPGALNAAIAQSLNTAYEGFVASGIDLKHPDKYYDNMDKQYKGISVFLERALQQKIEDDGLRLLNGSDIGGQGQNLTSAIHGGAMLNRHVSDVIGLRRAFEKTFKGLTINYFWAIDRCYIVMADVEDGTCLEDNRGPSQVRVCLPEFPSKSFWAYHISMEKEFDAGQGTVAPPKGWLLLSKESPNSPYTAGLTHLDVVRSSVEWYHMHNTTTPAMILNNTATTFLKEDYDIIGAARTGKLLPGTFRLPVLNNPAGEAISSIFQERSGPKHHPNKNYPCMAGSSPWADPGASYPEHDELEPFLQATGYYASQDWYQYCRHHHKCKTDENRSFAFREESLMKEKHIKHPWKSCGGKVDHGGELVGVNGEGYARATEAA